ncbi:hypothetical protein LPJ66_007208, partial [Kickxella alabastrina]
LAYSGLKRTWMSLMTRSRSSRLCLIRRELCRRGYPDLWEAEAAAGLVANISS